MYSNGCGANTDLAPATDAEHPPDAEVDRSLDAAADHAPGMEAGNIAESEAACTPAETAGLVLTSHVPEAHGCLNQARAQSPALPASSLLPHLPEQNAAAPPHWTFTRDGGPVTPVTEESDARIPDEHAFAHGNPPQQLQDSWMVPGLSPPPPVNIYPPPHLPQQQPEAHSEGYMLPYMPQAADEPPPSPLIAAWSQAAAQLPRVAAGTCAPTAPSPPPQLAARHDSVTVNMPAAQETETRVEAGQLQPDLAQDKAQMRSLKDVTDSTGVSVGGETAGVEGVTVAPLPQTKTPPPPAKKVAVVTDRAKGCNVKFFCMFPTVRFPVFVRRPPGQSWPGDLVCGPLPPPPSRPRARTLSLLF